MSKKNEYKPPKDEIPGWTTYLYEANRFREPHEFVNAWKWQEAAREAAKRLGIPEWADQTYLIEELENKNDQVIHLKALEQELETTVEQQRQDLAKGRRQLENAEADRIAAETRTQHQENEIVDLMAKIEAFGTHQSDCNWVDCIGSGRLHGTEEDMCDCGWLTLRDNLHKQLDSKMRNVDNQETPNYDDVPF